MADAARPGGEGRRGIRVLGWVGLGLVLIGAVLFALVVPAEADDRAYAAAPDCPAGTRADDCRAVLTATVVDKDTEVSRSDAYYLVLRAPGPAEGTVDRVRLPDDLPIYDAVRPGDKVTATYWKGEVREVRSGSEVQQVVRSPAQDGRLPGAFAVATSAIGLGLLWLVGWQRHRPAPKGSAHSWKPAVGIVAGVNVAVAGAMIVLLAADEVGSGLKFAAGAVVPVVLLSVLLCWGAGRWARGIVAGVVPVPPTERRCLGAVVHGDVPYSRPGYCYLVVGNGPLVATPDPTGRVALAPLPQTLTVRRVRESAVGDPRYDLGGRGEYTLVIECADGDREVLVFAGHKHASQVLGALLAASTEPSDYRLSD
ncbi:hypothetical protein G3I40_40815 [Streptomyces sp. SID14478]|uniref:hypothetical protein n=1 Tax=Streptomyces sp. SID14478 TaxID=2706073 RepID=UPI0013DF0D46|nr:hypothetical protein [Streptomyces sp. SID14478]NEB81509.1 hypothetical protein [Streptomyces sp. SID14478]